MESTTGSPTKHNEPRCAGAVAIAIDARQLATRITSKLDLGRLINLAARDGDVKSVQSLLLDRLQMSLTPPGLNAQRMHSRMRDIVPSAAAPTPTSRPHYSSLCLAKRTAVANGHESIATLLVEAAGACSGHCPVIDSGMYRASTRVRAVTLFGPPTTAPVASAATVIEGQIPAVSHDESLVHYTANPMLAHAAPPEAAPLAPPPGILRRQATRLDRVNLMRSQRALDQSTSTDDFVSRVNSGSSGAAVMPRL